MGRPTGRRAGTDKPAQTTFGVYELDDATRKPRGDALARFPTRPEADAFVRGLNFHDPKTSYAIQP